MKGNDKGHIRKKEKKGILQQEEKRCPLSLYEKKKHAGSGKGESICSEKKPPFFLGGGGKAAGEDVRPFHFPWGAKVLPPPGKKQLGGKRGLLF